MHKPNLHSGTLLPPTAPLDIAGAHKRLIDTLKSGGAYQKGHFAQQVYQLRLQHSLQFVQTIRPPETKIKKELSLEQLDRLFKILEIRFKIHMYRHEKITWAQVATRLANAAPEKLWSLNEMERTGGEPDVVSLDPKTGELKFIDLSAESPIGRRDCTYDLQGEQDAIALGYKPNGNAVDMLAAMGVEMVDETEYRDAQRINKLDISTWSWVKTTNDRRKLGVGLVGYLDDGGIEVFEDSLDTYSPYRGVRGSLRI